MALAVARHLSVANHPLTLASAIAARPASASGETPRRLRRLAAPATNLPAHNRIVLRGNTVCFR
jgi:hypothetical protein